MKLRQMTRLLTILLVFMCCNIHVIYAKKMDSVPAAKDRYIVIDLWERKLLLFEGKKVLKQYPVAQGRERYPSPIGEWEVTYKSRDWGGGFGSRWLGLNVPWGIYGIHGTNAPHSIGQEASHGCFRMFNKHIEELFELIPQGTKVTVNGPLPGRDEWSLKTLVRGARGSDVLLIQNRLRAAGYYNGPVDGIFGHELERAVKQWQKDMEWEVTAQISRREYTELGLIE